MLVDVVKRSASGVKQGPDADSDGLRLQLKIEDIPLHSTVKMKINTFFLQMVEMMKFQKYNIADMVVLLSLPGCPRQHAHRDFDFPDVIPPDAWPPYFGIVPLTDRFLLTWLKTKIVSC